MNKKIEDLDFRNMDLSEYQDQINSIQKTFENLKRNKRFMRKFNKFLSNQEKNYKVMYNNIQYHTKEFEKPEKHIFSLTGFRKIKTPPTNYEKTENISLFS